MHDPSELAQDKQHTLTGGPAPQETNEAAGLVLKCIPNEPTNYCAASQ